MQTPIASFPVLLGLAWILGSTSAVAQDIRTLRDDDSACDQCIHFTLDLVLGDLVGPGYVIHVGSAVRDSVGRYWLGQYRDMIKVFEPTGAFVTTVGRAGDGPGEFHNPMPVFADAEGMVHVIDPASRRKTVFRPDFQVHSTSQFPVNPQSLAPLPDENGVVVSASVRSVDGLGYPLHIVRDSKIVLSFGLASEGIVDPFDIGREVTADQDGNIFSVPHDEFLLEIWDQTGQRMAFLKGPPLREKDPKIDAPALGMPRSAITALQIDEDGRVWVLIARPSLDWREHMTSRVLPDGRTAFRPMDDDVSRVYTSEFLLVDIDDAAIVARSTRREFFGSFIGAGSALEMRQQRNGIPQLAIWTLSYSR